MVYDKMKCDKLKLLESSVSRNKELYSNQRPRLNAIKEERDEKIKSMKL